MKRIDSAIAGSVVLVLCLGHHAVVSGQTSMQGSPADWSRMAATSIIGQLERKHVAIDSYMRGKLVEDHGSYVTIDPCRMQRIEPGDVLEVAYPRTTGSDREGYRVDIARAAVLCVASVDGYTVMAKVIEKNITGSLLNPYYRVQHIRGQRWPIRIQMHDENDCANSEAKIVRSQLVPAIIARLERSTSFATLSSGLLTSTGGNEERRGAVLMDHNQYAYVSLNGHDGVRVGDTLDAFGTVTTRKPDGRLSVAPASLAVMRVIRVDATGCLCTVESRNISSPLDDPRSRVHVRVIPGQARLASVKMYGDVSPYTQARPAAAMPDEPRYTLDMDIESKYGEGDIVVTVNLIRGDDGQVAGTARVFLNSQTFRPMLRPSSPPTEVTPVLAVSRSRAPGTGMYDSVRSSHVSSSRRNTYAYQPPSRSSVRHR